MSASKNYMHPKAREALAKAEKAANMSVRIVQTQGNAPASAGTHGSDGTYLDEDGVKHSYSGAVDFSVNQLATRLSDGEKVKMDKSHIFWWLSSLARVGFVAWYRTTSQGFDAPHIHAVFAGAPLKPSLDGQVIDYLFDRNGLKGHARETFYTAPDELDIHIAQIYMAANPESANRVPAKYRGGE